MLYCIRVKNHSHSHTEMVLDQTDHVGIAGSSLLSMLIVLDVKVTWVEVLFIEVLEATRFLTLLDSFLEILSFLEFLLDVVDNFLSL